MTHFLNFASVFIIFNLPGFGVIINITNDKRSMYMKKKAKTLVALIAAAIMAIGLSACGSKDPDLESVLKKAQEIKSYDADYEMNAAATADGETQSIDIRGNMKLSGNPSEDMLISSEMTMEVMGMSFDLNYFYKNGYIFMDMMDQKFKAEVDYEQALKAVTTMPDFYKDGGIEIYSDITSEKSGSNTVFSYTISADKLNEMVGVLNSNSLLSATGIDGDYSVSKVTGSLIADKDNNIIEQTLLMSMEYSDLTMDMTIRIEMNEIEDNIDIVFPEDLDGYEEVDASLLEY